MNPRNAGSVEARASEAFERQLNEAMAIIDRAMDALEMHVRHLKMLRRRAAATEVLPDLRGLQEQLASPTAHLPKALPLPIRRAMLAVAEPVEVLLTNWKRMEHDARIGSLIQATSSATVLRNAVDHLRAERQIRKMAM